MHMQSTAMTGATIAQEANRRLLRLHFEKRKVIRHYFYGNIAARIILRRVYAHINKFNSYYLNSYKEILHYNSVFNKSE